MKKLRIIVVTLVFLLNCAMPLPGMAQGVSAIDLMRPAGSSISLSASYTPPHLKGLIIQPNDPLKFDFIIQRGQDELSDDDKQAEYARLIKYFLASLAVPDHEQWVNLSPLEKDRIIPDTLALTEMGRDLLAQDYLLKQIASSLTHPDTDLGKTFWDKVYRQAAEKFGSTDLPAEAISKVWIIPDRAVVYEKDNTVYVLENRLKVMLDTDYVAMKSGGKNHLSAGEEVTADVMREIILPALEKEVNEGKNFAPVRQIYSGVVLAAWYAQAMKTSLLGQIYVDRGKVQGVLQDDPMTNQQIYDQYVEAFRKGAYNLIREDVERYSEELIPRKYFSGGMIGRQALVLNEAMMIVRTLSEPVDLRGAEIVSAKFEPTDSAQIIDRKELEQGLVNAMRETAEEIADHFGDRVFFMRDEDAANASVYSQEIADYLRSLSFFQNNVSRGNLRQVARAANLSAEEISSLGSIAEVRAVAWSKLNDLTFRHLSWLRGAPVILDPDDLKDKPIGAYFEFRLVFNPVDSAMSGELPKISLMANRQENTRRLFEVLRLGLAEIVEADTSSVPAFLRWARLVEQREGQEWPFDRELLRGVSELISQRMVNYSSWLKNPVALGSVIPKRHQNLYNLAYFNSLAYPGKDRLEAVRVAAVGLKNDAANETLPDNEYADLIVARFQLLKVPLKQYMADSAMAPTQERARLAQRFLNHARERMRDFGRETNWAHQDVKKGAGDIIHGWAHRIRSGRADYDKMMEAVRYLPYALREGSHDRAMASRIIFRRPLSEDEQTQMAKDFLTDGVVGSAERDRREIRRQFGLAPELSRREKLSDLRNLLGLDSAMLGQPVGGVDFNRNQLELQIKRDGQGVPLPISQQDLEQIRIDGLMPVILDIRPASGHLKI